MQWIESIFLNCCSKRQTSEKKETKHMEMMMPEIEKEEAENYEMAQAFTQSLDEPGFNIIKLVPCFEENEEISRATTKASINSLDQAQDFINLACSGCQNQAMGYCVACPSRRFCSECFNKSHSLLSPVHRFCPYKSKVCKK